MKPVIALFDLDGVLIRPRGYRKAVYATLEYLVNQMGVRVNIPMEESQDLFESIGITNEWDMVPLSLAIILDEIAARAKGSVWLENLRQTAAWARNQALGELEIDYLKRIRQFGGLLKAGLSPSEAVLAAVQNGEAAIFPHLSGHPVLTDLLANTRWPEQSWVTHIFQTYVLGSEEFARLYGLAPEIETPSLLRVWDNVQIETGLKTQLERSQAQGNLRLTVYTARLSLQPREIPGRLPDYSAEAELAVDLLGWRHIPMIGYGRIRYLAEQLGTPVDLLIKPAPVQALAAMAAAWGGNEWQALEWAGSVYQYEKEQAHRPFVVPWERRGVADPLPKEFEVHIFEDSPVGIQAGIRAAETLRKMGKRIHLHTWGIAVNPDKAGALRALGAQVFPDVNQAVRTALNLV